MIETTNLEIAKKLIKNEQRPSIVKAQNDEFNRKILEYGRFDILLGVEKGNRKRGVRGIDSGFNEVLAKIAKKNDISLGIDLDELRNFPKEKKILYLERIKQNIMLCRKAKVKITLLNIKDKRNALAFMQSLGASSEQAKQSITF